MTDPKRRTEPMSSSDCNQSLAQLYEYLDGELTAERREAISTHLDACAPCMEAHDFEEALRRVVADKCRDTVPEQLRDRIAAAIESEAERS